MNRSVDIPPILVCDVLGLGPVRYDSLRSNRIAPLISSIITMRKVLCFTVQDLTKEEPSQFKDIRYIPKESRDFIERELLPGLRRIRESGSKCVEGMFKIVDHSSPRFKLPILWTSSFSGRPA